MAKVKGVQVSGTVSPALDKAIEDHRWTVRKTKAEVVRTAVEEYAVNHGIEWTDTDVEETQTPEAAFSDQT